MYDIYTDYNLSHYVIINKEPPVNIGYINVYIIFFILAFNFLKMILYSLNYDIY